MDVAAAPPPAPSRPSRGWVVAWGVVAALVALGVVLRWPLMTLGFTSDEVANVSNGTFAQIFDNPETGVNPPLWRWLWNVPVDAWTGAGLARYASLASSLLAIVLGFVVGRRAGRGLALAGLVAACMLAVHPFPVRYAALHRIYAFWSLLALVHVWAMGHALDAEPGRRRLRWAAVAVLTAMVLPWVHYFSVPVLLSLGIAILVGMPGRRRWVLAYVPAALGVLPLVPYVLFEEGRRVAPDREPMSELLLKLTSMDLHPPAPVLAVVSKPWFQLTGHYPAIGLWMEVSTAAVLVAGLLLWRRAPSTLRLALAGAVGVLAGAMVLGRVQYVRPATVVMVVTFVGVAIGAVPSLLPGRRARQVAVLVVGAWFCGALPTALSREAAYWHADEALPYVVANASSWEATRGDRAFIVSPAHRLWSMWFQLAHQVPRLAHRGPRCEGYDPCFEHEGVAWGGVDEVGDGHLLDGIVVSIGAWRVAGYASTCTVIRDEGSWGIFDCRRGR
ncbi:MAG: hypothetical protein H6733_01070 [Alphaproteobacteria bacterium]|nr:hypothetical protein [Alphaproteobacteria bacterium]